MDTSKIKRRRLMVEELENRSVPATLYWAAAPTSNHLASVPGNWSEISPTTGLPFTPAAAPAPTDTIVFPGDASVPFGLVSFAYATNQPCIVDYDMTVRFADIRQAYSSSISLAMPLNISDSVASGGLLFDGSGATISGYTNPATGITANGPLNISLNSVLVWKAGKFADVTVNVAPTSGVSVLDSGSSTNIRAMSGSAFKIDGKLSWDSGHVTVTNPSQVSSININGGGTFAIGASGTTWGVIAGAGTSYFAIQNNGLVTVDTPGVATLKGDFVNNANVIVDKGSFELAGKAEQSSGIFQLNNNSTVIASGTSTNNSEVLRIYNGTIKGNGTVNGNLTLGYDPLVFTNPTQTGATLSAGADNAFNDLTVTKSYQVFSPNAHTKVKVGDNGKTSKLVVSGSYAAMAGNLDITWANTNPPLTQEHVLIDIAGESKGKFTNFEEATQVGNQGVQFVRTYRGGDGNDVSLKPLIVPRVWLEWETPNGNVLLTDTEGGPPQAIPMLTLAEGQTGRLIARRIGDLSVESSDVWLGFGSDYGTPAWSTTGDWSLVAVTGGWVSLSPYPTIVFAAGSDRVVIDITATADGVTEGAERGAFWVNSYWEYDPGNADLGIAPFVYLTIVDA